MYPVTCSPTSPADPHECLRRFLLLLCAKGIKSIKMSHSRALASSTRVCTACGRRNPTFRQPFSSVSSSNSEETHIPRVADPSLWRQMVPRFARRDQDAISEDVPTSRVAPKPPRFRNPAIPFIVLGLLVGSFAINIIGLRREMLNFSRKTESKLALLREVIQRVKNGEDVDVKGLLGTGDGQQESEWEEVVQELESNALVGEHRIKPNLRGIEQADKSSVLKEHPRETAAREGPSRPAERQHLDLEAEKDSQRRSPRFMM